MNVPCDHFIDIDGEPWTGTYCKLRRGHPGAHSAHYPRSLSRDMRVGAAPCLCGASPLERHDGECKAYARSLAAPPLGEKD